MKKYVLVVLMILACGYVHARGESKFERWRSSEGCGAFTNILVATGAVYVKDVTVTSGTLIIAEFTYYNSSSTGLNVSTSTVYDVNDTGNVFLLDEVLKYGFAYTKSGASGCIRVRWDWYIAPNTGQEDFGIKD